MKQLLPFAAKWTIREDELIALKDSANGCLISTFATTTFGIQYRLQIYPNGNRKENHGKVFVFLVIKLGNLKEVKVGSTIKNESANNYSREIDHTFKESGGWGKCFCSTAELFDTQNGFIHDRKMELQVYGIFGENGSFCYKIIAKLGDELWAHEESKDFKIIVDGKVIMVHKLVLATMSPIFNDMVKDGNINELIISDFSFNIVEGALKEIYGCNFWKKKSYDDIVSLIQFYEKFNITSLKNRYSNVLSQLNGESVPQLIKIYTAVNKRSDMGTYDIGDKLWANEDGKDAKIIIGEKVLKVHKLVLAARCPKFAAMFVKNGFEVSGFDFDVVKMAMKTIYQCIYCNFNDSDELMKLLPFFYKYDCPSDKDDYERILISMISAFTVCDLTNCAISTKSTKLQEKCIEFLKAAYASNTPLCNSSYLDKNVVLKIIQNAGYRVDDKDVALKIFVDSFYQIIYTRKDNASMMSALK